MNDSLPILIEISHLRSAGGIEEKSYRLKAKHRPTVFVKNMRSYKFFPTFMHEPQSPLSLSPHETII